MQPKALSACALALVMATGHPALLQSLDLIEAALASQAGNKGQTGLAGPSALPHRHGVNQGEQ